MAQEELYSAVTDVVRDQWNRFQKPFLLSNLKPALEFALNEQAISYEEALDGRSLKAYLEETGSNSSEGFKLVCHPTQRAKIGVIPGDVEYVFPEDTEPRRQPRPRNEGASSDRAQVSPSDIEGFFNVLGSLSRQELERASLPARLFLLLKSA